MRQLGLERADFAAIRQAVVAENDLHKGKRLVSEAMLRIGVVGDAHEVFARCEHLQSLGAEHISFGPPLGPDPLAAIEVLGRQVLPHFN